MHNLRLDMALFLGVIRFPAKLRTHGLEVADDHEQPSPFPQQFRCQRFAARRPVTVFTAGKRRIFWINPSGIERETGLAFAEQNPDPVFRPGPASIRKAHPRRVKQQPHPDVGAGHAAVLLRQRRNFPKVVIGAARRANRRNQGLIGRIRRNRAIH